MSTSILSLITFVLIYIFFMLSLLQVALLQGFMISVIMLISPFLLLLLQVFYLARSYEQLLALNRIIYYSLISYLLLFLNRQYQILFNFRNYIL